MTKSLRIAVADDEPDTRESFERSLPRLGHQGWPPAADVRQRPQPEAGGGGPAGVGGGGGVPGAGRRRAVGRVLLLAPEGLINRSACVARPTTDVVGYWLPPLRG